MDTTRLTGTIVPAQVLLSDHEVQGILYGVVEVRGGQSEPLRGFLKIARLLDGLYTFLDYRVEDYEKKINMELAYQALQKYLKF